MKHLKLLARPLDRITYFINYLSALAAHEANIFNFYFSWMFLSILVFGFFGILWGGKNVYEKTMLLREMKTSLRTIQKNITVIKAEEAEISANAPYLQKLDTAIPATLDIQNFMVDFVAVSASSGYSVTSFQPTPIAGASEDTTVINISAQGLVSPETLIAALVKMPRLISLDSVKVVKNYPDYTVSTAVTIYTRKP